MGVALWLAVLECVLCVGDGQWRETDMVRVGGSSCNSVSWAPFRHVGFSVRVWRWPQRCVS